MTEAEVPPTWYGKRNIADCKQTVVKHWDDHFIWRLRAQVNTKLNSGGSHYSGSDPESLLRTDVEVIVA